MIPGRRLALLACASALSVSCARDERSPRAPQGTAPAPALWFRGRLRQLPPWGADLRRRCDPVEDGWATEAWAEWIELTLPDTLRSALAGDTTRLHASLDERFEGSTVLWPAELESVLDDGNLSVRRDRGIDPTLRPRTELAGLVEGWREVLADVPSPRVDLEVDGLESLGADAFETQIRLRVSGSAGAGSVQHNLRWLAQWSTPVEGPRGDPRLRSIRLERCEEVRVRVRPFADLTRAVLSRCEAFEEEILRGSDDYHLHQDRLSSQPFLAMHGLAVGDVDGNGLEDLYLPQPGGLPNRLLLHQEDGSLLDGTVAAGLDLLDNCGPSLILDLDGDGDQDVAVAAGSNILIGWNDGKGRFREHTVLPGPDAPEIMSLGAADPDRDGDLDLIACRYAKGGVSGGAPTPYWNAENGERKLYWRQEGERRFVEVAREVGLATGASRFGLAHLFEDLDDDGDVDLLVVNDFGRNGYYRNEGGKFTEVAVASGVGDAAAGMGVTCADVDRDGHLDLYLTNMDSPAGSRIAASPQFLPDQPELRPAYVHHARGGTLLLGDGRGRFRDATREAGVAHSGWAWGGTFFDLQNDGWPDLIVPNGFATNRGGTDLGGFFWRNVIGRSPRAPPAPQGYLDAWDAIRHFNLFEGFSWNGKERDFAYLNLGGLRFAEVSAAFEVDFEDDGRLVAPMDWDDDGRVDLWLRNRTGPRLRFLRNVAENSGHWISVELAGAGKNRDAIGGRVVVVAGGVRIPRTVYAAQGYLCAPSRRLHFGLGAATKAERIEVRWPDGTRESFEDVAADARYRIVQGEGQVSGQGEGQSKGTIQRIEPRRHPGFAELPANPLHVVPSDMPRIVLYDRMPAAAVELPLRGGAHRTVGSFRGNPLLVWVGIHDDPASMHLLAGLAAASARFDAVNTAFVALGRTSSGSAAHDAVMLEHFEDLGLGELAGTVDRRFHQVLEVFLVEILGPFDRLAYPLALLFDRAGQLTVVYSGTPSLDGILRDVETTAKLDPAGRSTEALLGGRWAQQFTRNLEGVAQIFDLLGDAEMARSYRGPARAGR